MLSFAEGNHYFFQKMIKFFYNECNARHPKYYFVKQMTIGVSLCHMPLSKEQYFMTIEAAARRNYKKAEKKGFKFSKIEFNNHIDDIWEIRRSATVRQGEISEAFLNTPPAPCTNPKSKSHFHDYPYFGVFSAEGKLVAYAGCLIAGEIAMIEHIYGHADFQSEGVVPKLIIDIGKNLYEEHPAAFWYGYGTFYGSAIEMQRFKRKFGFYPRIVRWLL